MFVVGDRVRIIKSGSPHHIGLCATIVRAYDNCTYYVCLDAYPKQAWAYTTGCLEKEFDHIKLQDGYGRCPCGTITSQTTVLMKRFQCCECRLNQCLA